ncbi:sigma-54-dependent transcriptional regulator, partial [Fibrobacterota bacterium]
MAKIAVIDDELLMRDLVGTSMSRLGHKVELASNGDAFLQAFSANTFDVVVTDLKMPGISGIELAEELLKREPGLPIILMTAHGTVDSAVKAMKMGVQDFIEKPFQVETLEHTVERTLEIKGLKRENAQLKESLSERYKFIGHSDIIKELLCVVDEVAASKSTVLIVGESGTGKELIAHAIHTKSLRYDSPFIKINCAAIPENLIESELFGHEKGAYTGAVRTRTGKFEDASGGTILLDEVGEMPVQIQSKLLRVLQEKELTKVGSNVPIPIDVRVICTTNRDLEKEIEEGTFREDLFYRLNVIPLEVPSLRDRKEDIPVLCEHFVKKYNKENGFSVPGISKEAIIKLQE